MVNAVLGYETEAFLCVCTCQGLCCRIFSVDSCYKKHFMISYMLMLQYHLTPEKNTPSTNNQIFFTDENDCVCWVTSARFVNFLWTGLKHARHLESVSKTCYFRKVVRTEIKQNGRRSKYCHSKRAIRKMMLMVNWTTWRSHAGVERAQILSTNRILVKDIG